MKERFINWGVKLKGPISCLKVHCRLMELVIYH